MKNLRYYLDTNAVQSFGTRLESLPNECVYTSVWTQLELVSAIKDDDSFRKKTAALRHLSDSGIFIDQIIPGAKKEQAFGCIAPEGGKIPHLSEVIMPMIFAAGNYEEFWKHIKCQGMEKCMELIGENFILLDSDVLLKRDISDLYEEDVIYSGEVIVQPNSSINRVLPFITYINTEKCVVRIVLIISMKTTCMVCTL